jgi:hypothetical protein
MSKRVSEQMNKWIIKRKPSISLPRGFIRDPWDFYSEMSWNMRWRKSTDSIQTAQMSGLVTFIEMKGS